MWALTALAVIQILLAFIRAVFSARIHAKIAAVGSTSYLWKVLRLPMEFFSQRMAGDIQQRMGSNASIAEKLVNTLSPLVIQTAMMVFYLVVMVRYSVPLTLLGVFSIVVNLFVSRYISRKRINLTRVQMRDSGKLSGTTVAGIEMIETIKASGAENGFFEKWSGYQASVNAQKVAFSRLNQYVGLIPQIVSTLTDTAVLVLGVWLVMEGQFTIGMVMAFQGFLSSFTAPASQLIGAGQTIQELRTDMERIEDVMRYPSDPACVDMPLDEALEYDKLSGAVELKNVTFGYSRLAEPLIRDVSMTLKQGSRVAFVGSSGCGKSTLAKLISGLYQPWSGEILFDGKPRTAIDRSVFTGSLAVVDQDIILFEDTIANNIKMWDSSIEDFEMILAARDAKLHSDIMQRDGGYNYKLTEGGKDLSGGQRQRLMIAQAIAPKPKILMFDEATSALDNLTQKTVSDSLDSLKCTRIVIAHRLSTIRHCDRILYLEKGKILEDGTYEEPIAKGGKFAELLERQRLDV